MTPVHAAMLQAIEKSGRSNIRGWRYLPTTVASERPRYPSQDEPSYRTAHTRNCPGQLLILKELPNVQYIPLTNHLCRACKNCSPGRKKCLVVGRYVGTTLSIP